MATRCSVFLAFVVLTSCTTAPAGPRLTSREVIRLADAEVVRTLNYDLRYFYRLQPSYSAKESLWRLPYRPKNTGDTQSIVEIDDKSRKVSIIVVAAW